MNNLVSLLKITFINSSGINKFTKEKSKIERNKAIFLTATIGFSIIALVSTLIVYFKFLAMGLEQLGLLEILLVMGFMASTAMILFTSIYKAQGILFSFKDYDLLASLPIKKSDILISKMMYLLFINYFFSLFTLLPSAIIYYKYTSISFIFFINLLLVFLVLPLVPIVIASIFAFGISYISSRVRHKNLFIILGTLGIAFFIFFLSFKSGDLLQDLIINSKSISEGILKIYPPAILAVKGLTNNNFLYILLFIVYSLLVFSVFIIIFSKSFNKISAKLQESYKKANYKVKEMKSSSQLAALVKKEIKRYFASPIYVVNTIFGPIMLIGMAVATIFLGEKVILSIIEVDIIKEIIPVFIIVVVCGILTLSCTTNSSISMEGKNLWVLKSSPINPIEIFKAKIIMNLILILPSVIIADIIFSISLNLLLSQFSWLLLISIIYSFIVPILGLIVNLYFPNLNWVSETAVVKQSASVLIQMIVGVGLIAIPVVIFIYGNIVNLTIFLIGIVIYEVIILIVLSIILNTSCVRLFNKL
ncbi:ABC transporter permease [Clostridium sp. Sa3CUN1]|uniref:ABC transporter permease n=1 Tax=Clostridium gallinarum TaxID=2762246 RepID=A0ABR8Q063_9CLOT|nr:ABC transporter permease [Clostridium gallinarum]MBD7913808.1 ABC transporter permease [Clostridium gallinarum]